MKVKGVIGSCSVQCPAPVFLLVFEVKMSGFELDLPTERMALV